MTDKKFYEGKKFRDLKKEWYGKLSDRGFKDIEGGVEGHLLQGTSGTVSLRSLANKSAAHHGLKNDNAPREFDEVADSKNVDLLFMGGGKARYFHHASELAAQAFREGAIDELTCYSWQLHARGEGERSISNLTGVPRSQIRKHLAWLRENIMLRIDNEHR